MDDLASLVQRLRDAPHGELRAIARESGVAYSTIRRIRDGEILNPGIETFDKLRSVYVSRPAAAPADARAA